MFFEVVGMITTGVVGIGIVVLLVALIKDFIGYQRGARNCREYLYLGEPRSQWFWFKHGVKRWARSFRHGSGWFVETADPEDDNYDLKIYESGQIERKPTRYPG